MIHYLAHDPSSRQPSLPAALLDTPSTSNYSVGLDALLPARLVELARHQVVNQASSSHPSPGRLLRPHFPANSGRASSKPPSTCFNTPRRLFRAPPRSGAGSAVLATAPG